MYYYYTLLHDREEKEEEQQQQQVENRCNSSYLDRMCHLPNPLRTGSGSRSPGRRRSRRSDTATTGIRPHLKKKKKKYDNNNMKNTNFRGISFQVNHNSIKKDKK